MRTEGSVVRRRVNILPAARAGLPIAVLGSPMWLANQGPFRLLVLGFLGLLVTDMVTAFVMARSIGGRIAPPAMIDVGVATEITTEVGWRSQGVIGAHFIGGWHSEVHFGAIGAGSISTTALRRGLISACRLRVATSGLFSMAVAITDLEFTFTQAIPAVPAALHDPMVVSAIDRLTNPAHEPELVGVRPYREGDRQADLHWPSIARTGETMVRERAPEHREALPVTIVVAGRDPEQFEVGLRKGRFAMAYAERQGLAPTLVVNTPTGVMSAVDSRTVANALASAVSGPPCLATDQPMVVIKGDTVR